jgi:outer membrane protein OmpA-like peptidoglycan-associated protein
MSIDSMKSSRTWPDRTTFSACGWALVLGCALSFGLPGRVVAQQAGDTMILKGNSVTEENLLNVLTPRSGVVTRGLKLRPNSPAIPSPTPAHKPSASLLITFETNSAELSAEARRQLDVVGAALKNDRLADYKFSVEGHADPRGEAGFNMELSRQRAESVRAYLVAAHGIGPERLVAEGKGDRELLNTAHPAAPENRRVTIVTKVQ